MTNCIPTSGHRTKRARDGFSLVELVIAVVILSIGVLGLAGTTAFVIRQVTLADVNTERSAALQTVIERLRATNPASIVSGSSSSGSFSITWSVTDSTSRSKTVRVITTGPGLRRDSAATVPMLGANVPDTFTMMVLR